MEICEVLVATDDIAFCHHVEQCVAEDSHDKEDQHDEDEDVSEGVHRHDNRLQQRLQRNM